jgi:hypothetical protein
MSYIITHFCNYGRFSHKQRGIRTFSQGRKTAADSYHVCVTSVSISSHATHGKRNLAFDCFKNSRQIFSSRHLLFGHSTFLLWEKVYGVARNSLEMEADELEKTKQEG